MHLIFAPKWLQTFVKSPDMVTPRATIPSISILFFISTPYALCGTQHPNHEDKQLAMINFDFISFCPMLIRHAQWCSLDYVCCFALALSQVGCCLFMDVL
jgi:hypothetical protein